MQRESRRVEDIQRDIEKKQQRVYSLNLTDSNIIIIIDTIILNFLNFKTIKIQI